MTAPTSSNDLILEMIREVIAERQRDLSEGLSMRAIFRMLQEHLQHDANAFAALQALIEKKDFDIRTFIEKRGDALDMRIRAIETARDSGGNTGRYQLAPPAPLPPTTINVGGERESRSSRRHSFPPRWLESAAKPVMHWSGIVLIVAASHILAKCGVTTPSLPAPPPPAHVEHP